MEKGTQTILTCAIQVQTSPGSENVPNRAENHQTRNVKDNQIVMTEASEAIVEEWLGDWSNPDPLQIESLTAGLVHNEQLSLAIQNVLEDRAKFPHLMDKVCGQLFSFYRSRQTPLQRFTLQFLPTLMFVYLAAVASGDRKNIKGLETLLLGMYNLEVVSESGEAVVKSFRLPSLAQCSLYHEPSSETLTPANLKRFEEVNSKPVTWGPHPQAESVNAGNRLRILTALLFVFNQEIAHLHKSALQAVCRTASRIVTQGLNKSGHRQSNLSHRIPVNAPLLLEFVSSLYFAMYNECGQLAMQGIEDIHHRSCFECFTDVILVANAIKNSAHIADLGETEGISMGISVALSPATTSITTVTKSMITNASFRTKKLPDDIPIVSGEGDTPAPTADNPANASTLVSISEEKEDDTVTNLTPRSASIRGKEAMAKNLQKLGIGKKQKAKSTTPIAERGSEKKKSVKSASVHNGGEDESPKEGKRKSTVDSVDGDLDLSDNVDVSPTSTRKHFDLDEKPLMQVSSV